jgi:hypothetical protein
MKSKENKIKKDPLIIKLEIEDELLNIYFSQRIARVGFSKKEAILFANSMIEMANSMLTLN